MNFASFYFSSSHACRILILFRIVPGNGAYPIQAAAPIVGCFIPRLVLARRCNSR
jgi:hypothetical protein